MTALEVYDKGDIQFGTPTTLTKGTTDAGSAWESSASTKGQSCLKATSQDTPYAWNTGPPDIGHTACSSYPHANTIPHNLNGLYRRSADDAWRIRRPSNDDG